MKKANVLKTLGQRRDLSHIREVYETKDVMEVNQRMKGNWEVLAAGPSGKKDLDKSVLFVLGRSEASK